jgi:hypothetical protein
VRATNLGLAFLLELAALAALAYWGYRLDASAGVRWVGAPLALALTWSRIAAPTARRRLARTPLLGFKLVVFTLAAALLYSTGRHVLAIVFEAATLLNLGLGVAWRQ